MDKINHRFDTADDDKSIQNMTESQRNKRMENS